jgi:hypothetical protein
MPGYRGHLIGGTVAWVVSAIALILSGNFSLSIPFVLSSLGLAIVGCLAPDIDTSKSIIGSFFEKLFFIGVFASGFYIVAIYKVFADEILTIAFIILWLCAGVLFYQYFVDSHRNHHVWGTHAIKAGITTGMVILVTLNYIGFFGIIQNLFLAGFWMAAYLSHLSLDNELNL